jgi:hypothetical protein
MLNEIVSNCLVVHLNEASLSAASPFKPSRGPFPPPARGIRPSVAEPRPLASALRGLGLDPDRLTRRTATGQLERFIPGPGFGPRPVIGQHSLLEHPVLGEPDARLQLEVGHVADLPLEVVVVLLVCDFLLGTGLHQQDAVLDDRVENGEGLLAVPVEPCWPVLLALVFPADPALWLVVERGPGFGGHYCDGVSIVAVGVPALLADSLDLFALALDLHLLAIAQFLQEVAVLFHLGHDCFMHESLLILFWLAVPQIDQLPLDHPRSEFYLFEVLDSLNNGVRPFLDLLPARLRDSGLLPGHERPGFVGQGGNCVAVEGDACRWP